uniref:Integrase catalytic domain-containing protein n=1 Tax=Chromera velia CCMP2878 TaxID=1169474 RepID=A0A0G4FRP5_9ALVE|eukprot:Cvel_18318.t1-p1 / transcript=Cvel_18318.t1 / gene=Cvel_18318 / organism=Chromera_velia_CCMP2878 / gene_product=hypothetical protein / transcript_product=hypothetical protein / location=Cvel_scaffold1511:36004-37475(+) / protein_length=279 / sequence_SO=supercontig / SO=protein_coding / is_pseudo=false
MEVVQTDNGKEFPGDKKGQYDHFCQEERIFHRRGADYTPQHQGQGERANRTVKRLLQKVRRQTGLPPYTKKWLFQGVVQELNNCVSTITGIQIQTGQLEMHAQQEGGEEGEREEREEAERDSKPRRGARRLPKREEREDGGGVPPSPVAENVEVDWGVDSDGNALHAQEGREEVQAAQDNEEKEEERLGKLKEELARVIVEKEKKRRPLPQIVPIDPTVVEKMMSHVNPRKGHIDATNEEVQSGSHEKGMLDELQRFLDEMVFRRGVRVPKGRKVMRCR